MTLEAVLAIKTKRDEDIGESRVLNATRGPLLARDYDEIFLQLSVGSLASRGRQGQQDAPPWLVWGSQEAAGRRYGIVVRHEWTARSDRSDRPVPALGCLCVPFEGLAAATASAVDLLAALPSSDDMLGLTRPLPVALPDPATTVARWAATIEEIGYTLCAGLAAALIESPVALVQGGRLDAATRLRYLDAVAALLPYGCRASLAFSTWVKSSTDHAMRLGFTDGPRASQRRVVWGQSPATELAPDGPAARYYATLVGVRERHALPALLAHLAACRSPLGFDRPDEIAAALTALDRPHIVWRDVGAGTARPQQVREVLQSGEAAALTGGELDLLRYLLLGPDLSTDDVETLAGYWSAWGEQLRPALEEAGRAALLRDDGWATIERLTDLAKRVDILDDFVLGLIVAAGEAGASENAAVVARHAIEALHIWWSYHEGRPGAAGRPIGDRLVEQLDLLHGWLTQALRVSSQQRLFRALKWLGAWPGPRAGLPLYAIAAGLLDQDATLDDVEAVARVAPVHVLAVAASAAQQPSSKQAERLFPAVGTWLCPRATSLDTGARASWLSALITLLTVRPSSRLQAVIDLGMMTLDLEARPRHFAAWLERPDRAMRAYGDWFGETLITLPDPARLDIIIRLLAVEAPSLAGAERVLGLAVTALPPQCPPAALRRLYEAVLRMTEARPDIFESTVFVDHWHDRIARSEFGFVLAVRAFRQSLASEPSVEDVARRCASILAAYPDADEHVIGALDEANYFKQLRQILAFERELQQAFRDRAPIERVEIVEARLTGAILAGRLAAPLRQFYADNRKEVMLADLRQASLLMALLRDYLNEDDLAAARELLRSIHDHAASKGAARSKGGLSRWLSG